MITLHRSRETRTTIRQQTLQLRNVRATQSLTSHRLSSLLNKMETMLPNINLVCQRAMSGCGKEVKRIYRRHLCSNVQTVESKLCGWSLRSICWHRLQRGERMAQLSFFSFFEWIRLAKEEKYNIPVEVSKGNHHWCQGFMEKNGLSLQQKTILAKRLPNNSGEKFALFHHFINHHKKHNYLLHLIVNMEALLTFNIPPNCTINNTAEKALKICTKGKPEELSYSCVGLLWKCLISAFIHKCEHLVSDRTSHIFRHFSTISLHNLMSFLAS